MLEVAVHGDQDGASCAVDPGLDGGSLAEVSTEPDPAHPGIRGRSPADRGKRLIRASVVDEQDLETQGGDRVRISATSGGTLSASL